MYGAKLNSNSLAKLLLFSSPIIALLFGCASGSIGENANTKVEGNQNSLVFSWEQSHPWSAQLAAQGSRYSLFAQYITGGRPVEQNLGRPQRVTPLQWTFLLPRELRSAPEGHVCLFFSQSQHSPSIPIRAKAIPGGDTARFRFPDWEKLVAAGTKASAIATEIKTMESSIADSKVEHARLKGELERNGVKSMEDCSRAPNTIVTTQIEATPADVLLASQQADAAERICVRRSRNMKRFRAEYRVDLDVLTEQLITESSVALPERSKSQAKAFLNHWTKWRDRTGPEYTPQLGSSGEGLPTGGVLDVAVSNWNNATIAKTAAARVAVTSGLLDAYSGCLEDVGKQLTIRSAAWQSAQTNRPARDRIFAERKREQCQSLVSGLEGLTKSLAEQEGQLSVRRRDRSSTGLVHIESNQTRPVTLNGLSCSV